MLLESRIVYVPAQCELDADQNDPDFEGLSSKTRAAFGAAAVEAGDPDFEASDELTSASDVIANILHWVNEYHSRGEGVAPDPIEHVLESARRYFEEESGDEG